MELERAQGCLLGQLAGDSLGSLVEFMSARRIRNRFPDGVRELKNGGTWNTLAGQPTDDSELALMLARTLVKEGTYNPQATREAYIGWLESDPFDCGTTTRAGLFGTPIPESQANGALMRVSPLGIFGAKHPQNLLAQWAEEDAALTHPHRVCRQANALYTTAIAKAIREGTSPTETYEFVRECAKDASISTAVRKTVETSSNEPPQDFMSHQGWVLVAFGNALWQLLHAPNLEEGVVDTVMRGGDTDTNAAICGALMGAVYGRSQLPSQWEEAVLNCRPEEGRPGVRRPRPERFWPVDALELAEQLLG